MGFGTNDTLWVSHGGSNFFFLRSCFFVLHHLSILSVDLGFISHLGCAGVVRSVVAVCVFLFWVDEKGSSSCSNMRDGDLFLGSSFHFWWLWNPMIPEVSFVGSKNIKMDNQVTC